MSVANLASEQIKIWETNLWRTKPNLFAVNRIPSTAVTLFVYLIQNVLHREPNIYTKGFMFTS